MRVICREGANTLAGGGFTNESILNLFTQSCRSNKHYHIRQPIMHGECLSFYGGTSSSGYA